MMALVNEALDIRMDTINTALVVVEQSVEEGQDWLRRHTDTVTHGKRRGTYLVETYSQARPREEADVQDEIEVTQGYPESGEETLKQE